MCKRNTQLRGLVVSLLVILSITGLFGCSSKSTSNDIPSASQLSVTASPSSVTKGTTSIVEATMTASGTPLANQVITFTVAPTDAGYFTPTTDTTGADGVSAVVFTATISGSAIITASVEGSSLKSTAGITIVEVAQEGTGNITLAATPSLLLANGTDTSTITITVRDANGVAAPDSTAVKLVSGEKFVDIDGNGYWTAGVDSLVYDGNLNGIWDATGSIPSIVYTSGGAGNASAYFISGNDATLTYIRATVSSNGVDGYAELALQLNPDAAIAAIFLASDSMSLSVKSTGGIEIGDLRAICYDAFGNTVPEGLPVDYIIVSGPDGGEYLGNVGPGQPYRAITNSQGVATATLHSGTISGTVRIRATADTVMSEATQVLITAGPPKYITIASEFCNIDYWDNVAERVVIKAVVADTFLNPVNDSTVVYFSTNQGTMKSHEERTFDHEGIAKTLWFSGNNVPTADGRVFIYAETAGGTVADTGMFLNTHTLATLIISGFPTSLIADGKHNTLITVQGRDLNGNFVIDGTKYNAKGKHVAIGGGLLRNGCDNSTHETKITSLTLEKDESLPGGIDDSIGAIGNVSFTAENGTASITLLVTLRTGEANKKNCDLDFDALSGDYGESIYFSYTVKDRWFNPLGDHTITASATNGGVVIPGTKETDAYGDAKGFRLDLPPASSGASEVVVTVSDTDPAGSGIVFTKKITIPTKPVLTLSPTALDFGLVTVSQTFDITNTGTGTNNWTIATDKAWITVDITSGATIDGTDVITVTVDRSGLATGNYTGAVNISSDAGAGVVTVSVDVP